MEKRSKERGWNENNWRELETAPAPGMNKLLETLVAVEEPVAVNAERPGEIRLSFSASALLVPDAARAAARDAPRIRRVVALSDALARSFSPLYTRTFCAHGAVRVSEPAERCTTKERFAPAKWIGGPRETMQ